MNAYEVKRWRTNKLSPLEVAAIFAGLTYVGIGGVLVVGLFNLGAIAIAFVSIVIAYTVASLWLTPRVDKSALTAESHKAAWAQLKAERRKIKQAYANKSRWWHHLIGAICGSMFGALLAIVLAHVFVSGS